MKLAIETLLAAHQITHHFTSSQIEVIVLDDTVDVVTGEPVQITVADIDELSVQEIALRLVSRYAGDTAFIIRSDESFAVVRPPFSELQLFYCHRDGNLEMWSGLHEVPKFLQSAPPLFDLEYLSQSLFNMSWVTPATGLSGVFELLSGAILTFDGSRLSQTDIAARAVVDLCPNDTGTYEDDVHRIRNLIANSLRHKTLRHRGQSSLLCSGGLDSSVLTVALASLFPSEELKLINCYSIEDRDGDERMYFREVAAAVRARVTEVETNSRSSRQNLSPQYLAPTVRPTKTATTIPTTSLLYETAAAHGSKIVLTGDGGDQLFLLNSLGVYTRELIREAHTAAAVVHMLAGIAIRDRRTIWAVLGETAFSTQSRRLRARLFESERVQPNPLSDSTTTGDFDIVPGATRLRSMDVSRAFQFIGMRNAELNRVAIKDMDVTERKPFVFWPLIRAAIQLRRTHHFALGRDRSLARDAYASELPSSVYNRVRKGAGRDLLERYDYDALLRRLLDGPCALHRILSIDKLKHLLGNDIDDDLALSVVRANGISDWMTICERKLR